MSAPHKLAAQILETSAAGFAGLATGVLFDRDSGVAQRYESDAFSRWKAELQQWLLGLAAALDTEEPSLFASRMAWTKKTFLARQTPVDDLRAGLAALRDVLRERLPDGCAEVVAPVLEGAITALASTTAGDELGLDPKRPEDRPVLTYLKTILEGDSPRAVRQLLDAVDGGISIESAYLEILIPAQREAGRLWQAAELSIAEEHVVTATTQRAMTLLCARARPVAPIDRTVLLACVAGNIHDIGVRVLSDFFEMAGWRAVNLGADVPHEEVARGVQFFNADVVVLAVTLDTQLREATRAIERTRAVKDRKVRVIVGGPIFDRAPELWRKIGAHGYSPSLKETEPLARQLSE